MITSTQAATLKALAQADTTALGYMTNAEDAALAAWFNVPTTFVVYRSQLPTDLSRMAILVGASQLDNLTVGKRDALLWLCSESLNPNDPNVRQAISDLCGSQNTLKNSLLASLKRFATRAEKALATGTGTDADPGTLVYEGIVSQGEASNIR
ncbi:hypothetical protein [Propionivibrio sp.]|uniref:hypothetical protein n=1 Tax=Propionivibrio sp. TaxID=2212460 RepID=UPI0025E3FD1B|nr:hypothetical protein [Propionivibrio sp.]MBK7356392.1 hypothetical protein [Propionivibrio sp.]